MHAATITAQVAVEAIVNDPDGFDLATMNAVYDAAQAAHVATLYLHLLAGTINDTEQAVDA